MTRPCGLWTGAVPASQFRSVVQIPSAIDPLHLNPPELRVKLSELRDAFQGSQGIAYTSPEFGDAFNRYGQIIKGNINLQDEANFLQKALPHYDLNRDGFVTWHGELETVQVPAVRDLALSFWRVFENSKECPAEEFPYTNQEAEKPLTAGGNEIEVRLPEEMAEAQRDFHRTELWIRSAIFGGGGLLIGALIVGIIMKKRRQERPAVQERTETAERSRNPDEPTPPVRGRSSRTSGSRMRRKDNGHG